MPRKLIRGNLTVTGTITSALGAEYSDAAFTVKNSADATKKVRLSAAGVTAGQTRVLTAPDYNGTIATLAGTEALTNKTLTAPKVGTALLDTNGLELLKVTATATAVNEVTLANAATGGAPKLSATGDDTHISLKLAGKGNGKVVAESGIMDLSVASANNTASDLTYTAAQMLGGLYLRDCNGGARADILPTAANMVAAIPGAVVGTSFRFLLRNSTSANHTITATAPDASVTISGTATVAQSNTKEFLVVLTNVGSGTEAYTIYSLGTFVH